MKFFRKTYYSVVNSVRKLAEAPLPILLAFFMPLFAWLCISLAFTDPEVKNVPIGIVDKDNSNLSRMVTRSLGVSGYVKIYDVYSDADKAIEDFKNMKIMLIVNIPKDFQKDIKCGQGAKVIVQENGGKLIYSKIGYRSVATTLSSISSGVTIQRLEAKGYTPSEAMAKAVPIRTDNTLLGNPYVDYAVFLLPALLMSLVQMSSSFSTLWIFRSGRENEGKRVVPKFGHFMPFVLGRTIPIFIANMASVTTLFLFIFPITGIWINHSYFILYIYTCFFSFVCMGIGMFCSITFKNIATASQFLLVMNASAFVFSGYTFPTWGMPKIIYWMSYGFPLTYFVQGIFPLYTFDQPIENGVLPLVIIGFLGWFGSFLAVMFYRNINNVKRKLKMLK